MKLKEFRTIFINSLSTIYDRTEIDNFFFLLIEDYLGLQRIDTVLNADLLIDRPKKNLLNKALTRLKKEEPIQYILGRTEFYGLSFLVNENTLIPRPETEELVEWILTEIDNKNSNLSILDIGTGTGCIAITLAKHLPNAKVTAIDISKKAIDIAKQNAKKNQVSINFVISDILKISSLNTNQNQVFDIIVSNPPYVRELEKKEIKNNVLENEPHLALFVSDLNPLIFYDKIADFAKLHLKNKGLLFFEINQYLGKETVALLHRKNFKNIKLKKDIFKNDRMIKSSY